MNAPPRIPIPPLPEDNLWLAGGKAALALCIIALLALALYKIKTRRRP